MPLAIISAQYEGNAKANVRGSGVVPMKSTSQVLIHLETCLEHVNHHLGST